MSPTEILDIIRSFFEALRNILDALGINFGQKKDEVEETTTG